MKKAYVPIVYEHGDATYMYKVVHIYRADGSATTMSFDWWEVQNFCQQHKLSAKRFAELVRAAYKDLEASGATWPKGHGSKRVWARLPSVLGRS